MKLESNWSKLERSTQKYEHLYLGARVHHKQTNLGGVSEDNNISNHDFKIVIEFTCTPMLTYKRRLSNGAFNLIEAIYKDYKMTDRLEKKTNAVAPQLWHFPPINPLESSPFLRTLPEPRTWQRLRFLPFCLWGIPKKCPRVQSEENKKLWIENLSWAISHNTKNKLNWPSRAWEGCCMWKTHFPVADQHHVSELVV